MVVHTRLRSLVRHLALYVGAVGVIAYFAFHAFSGNHGLEAHRFYADREKELSAKRATLKVERETYERRVALMRSQSIDPDLLDEKTREMLGKVDANDVVVMKRGATE
jgi:cell division protein FtsB